MRIANTIHQLFVFIATAALFSTTIGCVVVIEPGDDLPWSPPGELCPTHEIACEIGQTPVSLGTDESGCDIYTCAEVTCETDDDCEGSDMGCRLPEADGRPGEEGLRLCFHCHAKDDNDGRQGKPRRRTIGCFAGLALTTPTKRNRLPYPETKGPGKQGAKVNTAMHRKWV